MLKVGIIGAGVIAGRHIENFLKNENVEIKAISNRNIEKAEKLAKKYSIENVYNDYHDILNDNEIDAVSITTATYSHKDIVIDAILKGLDAQVDVMVVNIFDCAISIAFIYFIVPILGFSGYIISIFISEVIDFSLSGYKLMKILQKM